MESEYKSNINVFYWFRIFSSLELTLSIFVLFFLSNGLTMTQVMLMETIFIALVLVLEVPSGAFADLFGRKLSLTLGMFFLVLAFVFYGLGTSFWTFLIGQIANAFSWVFFSGADSALLYDSLKEMKREEEYMKVYGRVSFVGMLVFSMAGLMGGFLLKFITYRQLFFVTAFLFFLGFLLTFLFKEPPIHEKSRDVKYIQHLRESIKYAYNHKVVWNLIVYFGLFAALGHLTWFLIQPIYGAAEFPKYLVSVVVFLYLITYAFGNLFTGKLVERLNEEKLLIFILLLSSLCFLGIFFVNKIVAIILISVMSFACGVRDLVVNKGINANISSHQRATIISIQGMSKSLMYMIFAPIIGYLTDLYSPAMAFLAMGIGLFIFFLYYFIMILINRKASKKSVL